MYVPSASADDKTVSIFLDSMALPCVRQEGLFFWSASAGGRRAFCNREVDRARLVQRKPGNIVNVRHVHNHSAFLVHIVHIFKALWMPKTGSVIEVNKRA